MKSVLYEPQSGILTVPYKPDESARISENPPRFTWMPARMDNDRYMLQISKDPSFSTEKTRTYGPIPYNLFTPDRTLDPGIHYWRYALLEAEQATGSNTGSERVPAESELSEWSTVRSFTIDSDLPETPLPAREKRYPETVPSHPRLWLNREELERYRKNVKENPSHCSWDVFYEGSVLPWMSRDLISEPEPYPGNKRSAALWRKSYIDCQETLYAIRHLSVAGAVTDDEAIRERAKQWLLHAASWDPEGTTSRDYNDESSFRMAGALAWGYDWLYSELSEAEREQVRSVLLRRTEQVAHHVIERSKIHHVPYDSHAVRSLSSVLVPCCIALFGEEPQAKEWLDYAVEYFSGLYTPWGGEDGGWAEGAMYWTTGMAYVIDAMNLLKKFSGIDFYQRPFFRKTGDFPLYCFSPDTIRASFGDQSNLGEPISLKTGYNIRQFAGVTGNGHYQWYYEQAKIADPDADSKYYNYGWWDFRFDEMVYLHDYPVVPSVSPVDAEPLKWFRDVGWAAMHYRMDDPEEHIMLLTKSSPYGSISHSHGDQNGFLLHAFGEPLAIESGHYVAFNSTMHLNWRKQTRSVNGLLVDGQGQYAGSNKVLNMAAKGSIVEAKSTGAYQYVRMDATAAYQENVPHMKRYEREIYFYRNSYFVLVDSVDLTQPGSVEWLLHARNEMKLKGQTFQVLGDKADLHGQFVYSSSGEMKLQQHNEFTDVDPSEYAGLPEQWHLTASTRKADHHRIVTLLVPMKKHRSKYVSFFMDDQGFAVNLYFTDNGETDKLEIPKIF